MEETGMDSGLYAARLPGMAFAFGFVLAGKNEGTHRR
jgi:tetrahydromethanopterin S-methyltransferase subunit F